MNGAIIFDEERRRLDLREVLRHQGVTINESGLLTCDGFFRSPPADPPELAIVGLRPDPDRGMDVLADLRRRTRGLLLAAGPHDDSRLVLRALRAGADDFIDLEDAGSEIIQALARHKASRDLETQTQLAKTLVFLSASGGGGASTLATNVGACLAREHGSSALIDLSLESGDLASLLDLKAPFSLADVCKTAARLDRAMLERSFVRHESGAHLLASPARIADAESVTAEGFARVLELARQAFPCVVIDLDRSFRPPHLHALRTADLVVVVFRLEFASLKNTQKILEHLGRAGVDQNRFRLVVNRQGQPREVPAAKAEGVLGMKVFHSVPDDPKAVQMGNNLGVPFVIGSPKAKVARSIAKLASEVVVSPRSK